MAKFIDINRLDYLNPIYIRRKEEFIQLQHFSRQYRHKAAEFLIKNNISRCMTDRNRSVFSALRLCFRNVWEWHIPDMMDDAIRELGSCIFEEPPHSWDCIWMLKVNKLDDPPLYFCDIAIFWNEKIKTRPLPENGKWSLKVKNDPVDAELLIPPMLINDLGNDLQKLYRPNKSHILLQCKFAHDMD